MRYSFASVAAIPEPARHFAVAVLRHSQANITTVCPPTVLDSPDLVRECSEWTVFVCVLPVCACVIHEMQWKKVSLNCANIVLIGG